MAIGIMVVAISNAALVIIAGMLLILINEASDNRFTGLVRVIAGSLAKKSDYANS